MRAPASYVAGLGRGASGFTTRSDIGPAREEVVEAADANQGRGEELEANPDQFQDPDNETGLFAGKLHLLVVREYVLMMWVVQGRCTRQTTRRQTGFTRR
jgi:hypothetical protein